MLQTSYICQVQVAKQGFKSGGTSVSGLIGTPGIGRPYVAGSAHQLVFLFGQDGS